MPVPTMATLILDFALQSDRLYQRVVQHSHTVSDARDTVPPSDSLDRLSDDDSIPPRNEAPARPVQRT